MQKQTDPQPTVARQKSGPRSRHWFHRNRRMLGDIGKIALLALVLFPFAWLVQMSFRPNSDILGYDLLFTTTLDHSNMSTNMIRLTSGDVTCIHPSASDNRAIILNAVVNRHILRCRRSAY